MGELSAANCPWANCPVTVFLLVFMKKNHSPDEDVLMSLPIFFIICRNFDFLSSREGLSECSEPWLMRLGMRAQLRPMSSLSVLFCCVLLTVPTFAVRETDVSRHNGGTSGALLKPLRDDSALRVLSSLRGLGGQHLRNGISSKGIECGFS